MRVEYVAMDGTFGECVTLTSDQEKPPRVRDRVTVQRTGETIAMVVIDVRQVAPNIAEVIVEKLVDVAPEAPRGH